MLTVHHLDHSRSQRVLWLLEELEAPYEIAHYQRDAETMLAPPALRTVHPLGKSPVITDGDLTLAETGAIVEYILATYGQGRLQAADRWRQTYWLHYAEGSAMPPLLTKFLFDFMPDRAPWFMKGLLRGIGRETNKAFIGPQLKMHFDYWESELTRSAWFAGDEFNAADVMMSFPVEVGVGRADAAQGRPKLQAFLERIQARPAYKKAVERGGPYGTL
jgi:glutathione S-transferase